MNTDKETVFSQLVTESGHNLYKWSHHQPLFIVFLRHFGCTFCREALADISKIKDKIRAEGKEPVFIHMSSFKEGKGMLSLYDLQDCEQVSDPDQLLYKFFQLEEGNFKQLFGLKSWLRGIYAGVLKGHLVGRLRGNGFRMGGYFVYCKGQVQNEFKPWSAADRPNYQNLVACPC